MMLHVAYAARHGHQRILVRTVDTDVVVLAVMVAQKLSSQYEIWLAFGTGKNFRYLAAHEMASCLGLERSLALPMFHAMTGCDTVSSFVGHGKKTCMDNLEIIARAYWYTAEVGRFTCKSYRRSHEGH